MVLTYLNNWSQMGVDIIGEIPEGLPNIKKPVLNPRRLIDLFPLAFTIALVAYMEAISISKSLEEKNKNYKINANQELIALGMSNIAGSFFQSFSTTGGFSRTAVNDASGAKTGVALLISALVVTIILIFFTSWFYYLPKTILSAIIIVSVLNLVDFKYSIVLFKKHKDEFFLLLSTFMITLFIGLKEGLLLGIMLSFLIVFFRLTSFPNSRILILDRIRSLFLKKQSIYFSKEGNNNYDIVLLDIKGQLFFGNIDYFKNFMYKIIKEKRPELKGIILNINNLYHIDSTGHDTLLKIVKKIQEKKVRIIISRNIEHERDVIFGYNLISLIKKKNIFNTSAEALKSFNKSKKNLPNEN
jgi:SulP family sulfate permease